MYPDIAANAIVFALIQSVLLLLLIRFLGFYDREPLSLLALLFVWGAVGATAISGLGNAALDELLEYESPELFAVLPAALNAPLVEETAKGIALLAVFALSGPIARYFGVRMFNGVTNGIVYGAAVGLGFSFAEDIFYFFREAADAEDLEAGLNVYLYRVYRPELGQLGHAVYTGTFGAGLGLAVWSRSWISRVFFPLLGFGAAMFMHAVNNGLLTLLLVPGFGFEATAEFNAAAESGQDPEELLANFGELMVGTANIALLLRLLLIYVFGAVFFLSIWLWVRYQRRVIHEELAEEVETGLISNEEWEMAPRYLHRLLLYWRLLSAGKVEQWRASRQLYNELADLALLKRRLKRRGGDWDQIERLKRRIETLKAKEIVG